ncbi:MAG: hypothetical protein KatS3mg106_260 [Gemmataceae bacterium]|jgi:hypothetical protein|nr:MAG: hypothetical protein KatS3mg106_260 [Gemmataceae bacterium]
MFSVSRYFLSSMQLVTSYHLLGERTLQFTCTSHRRLLHVYRVVVLPFYFSKIC